MTTDPKLPEPSAPVAPLAPQTEEAPPSTSVALFNQLQATIVQFWQNLAGSDGKATMPLIVIAITTVPIVILLSSVLDFLDELPLVPELLELVGLIYVGWFIYRHLLFAQSRQELLKNFDTYKQKIFG
jgi:hypothetical protein